MISIEDQTNFLGNVEHLVIFLHALNSSDIKIWNKWRTEDTTMIPDLKGLDLSAQTICGFDFSGLDLSHVDLKESSFMRNEFKNVDFSHANLSHASFKEAKLENITYKHANLSGANFIFNTIHNCNFDNTEFTYAVIMNAQVVNTSFTSSNLFETHLHHNTIENISCDYIFMNDERSIRCPKRGDLLKDQIETIFTSHIHITPDNIKKIVSI